jgi:hypothetical protein
MNYDITFWSTTGSEPNLRITSNRGFERFDLFTSANVGGQVFRDGDLDAANDWQAVAGPGSIGWALGTNTDNHLFWGTLFSYSFTSNAAPGYGNAQLTGSGAAAILNVRTIVPRG